MKRISFLNILLFIIAISGCSKKQPEEIFNGQIESNINYISSEQSGKIEKLFVIKGQNVLKNASLYKLSNETNTAQIAYAVHAVKQAEFELANIQKGVRPEQYSMLISKQSQLTDQLDIAKDSLKKAETLYKLNHISDTEIKKIRADYYIAKHAVEINEEEIKLAKLGEREDLIKSAEEKVEQLKSQLNLLTIQSGQKTIFSPISGRVNDVYFREGEFVSAGQPALSIESPEEKFIVLYVQENSLSLINYNSEIEIKCTTCSTWNKAYINYIANKAEFTPTANYSQFQRKNLTYRIEAKFNNHSKIVDKYHTGQPIDIRITRTGTQ